MIIFEYFFQVELIYLVLILQRLHQKYRPYLIHVLTLLKINISKLLLTKDQIIIIIIGQYYTLKYTMSYILEIIMNIVKFEKKSFFKPPKNTNKKYDNVNIRKIEKNFIFFSKFELTSILNLYSKQVSKGYWKDYALDSKVDYAIFSIFKHSQDKPMYQIIKNSQKGFRYKPSFYIKKDEEVISKSYSLLNILSNFEKKLSIKKLKNH